jgi:TusE/DsrC/DsvC family sulfur relay protein
MSDFDTGGLPVAVDDKGYLKDFDAWTRDIALALAVQEEIAELTADHWRVIDFLRRYQGDHGVAPMIRVLCKETGFSLKEIYTLFPSGPAKGACRVAGLPRPDSCV